MCFHHPPLQDAKRLSCLLMSEIHVGDTHCSCAEEPAVTADVWGSLFTYVPLPRPLAQMAGPLLTMSI